LVTGHQAFFTEEALTEIANSTLASVAALYQNKDIDPATVLV
jgi:D-lactate dehydrogenase